LQRGCPKTIAPTWLDRRTFFELFSSSDGATVAKKWKSFDLDLDSVSGIYTSAP
jgi:hypothetical protein